MLQNEEIEQVYHNVFKMVEEKSGFQLCEMHQNEEIEQVYHNVFTMVEEKFGF